ncbi:hypothetical protein [Mucisphaera calidilacus]|uniref:Uncharacterized protein n=1 Tax=Mucisphaera calidilacus TaxID=2527982 RepID=A0A518BYJ9_9BACT|nr:hypothetical protein [Mucisphaera calidilacus]QDU72045.1 hypothetical protein Pan265_19050 [Mucisphaera calidilacus]
MQRRSLRWLSVLWCLLWFAVILPGHQRGAIALPGSPDTPAACPLCLITKAANTETPLAPPAGGCMICHLKATITTPPPPVHFDPVVTRLDDLPTLESPSLVQQIDALRIRSDRAPPAA